MKQAAEKRTKPKVAIYWLASCGGCDETVVDLDAAVLEVIDAVDIVLWPMALDFKGGDVEKLATARSPSPW